MLTNSLGVILSARHQRLVVLVDRDRAPAAVRCRVRAARGTRAAHGAGVIAHDDLRIVPSCGDVRRFNRSGRNVIQGRRVQGTEPGGLTSTRVDRLLLVIGDPELHDPEQEQGENRDDERELDQGCAPVLRSRSTSPHVAPPSATGTRVPGPPRLPDSPTQFFVTRGAELERSNSTRDAAGGIVTHAPCDTAPEPRNFGDSGLSRLPGADGRQDAGATTTSGLTVPGRWGP